ncbi:hypothetical protein A1353_05790 [Methylomonas methanica]|uniref:Restriction endonuclease n=1 Tax=Methylomonas methanica TaxID=421 RepID=A0A177MTI0_METMH|nr:hypothetical protein [Methylomonas methanica]OAI08149.1 hypothetical protein A1353_05790 [Methylomonas methanica]
MMDWIKREESVGRKILSDLSILASTIGITLTSAFPKIDEHAYGQDVLIASNVLRENLGLPAEQKPGDIDFLIVPYNGNLMLEKTIAIELKIVRPTINKPGKNANSMGVTQAKGLLRDGFPFVGLIHVVIPEALPKALHVRVPLKHWESDGYGGGELKDTGETLCFDPFPGVCAQRQEGRILISDLPEDISYRVIGLDLKDDDMAGSGCTYGEQRIGKLNRNFSSNLLEKIQSLIEQKPEIFQHIKWYGSGSEEIRTFRGHGGYDKS